MHPLLNAAQWLGLAALACLVQLQRHMWLTGSGFTRDVDRWLFASPFHALLVTASLAAAAFYAWLCPVRLLKPILILLIGGGIPGTIVYLLHHCYEHTYWAVTTAVQDWMIEALPLMVSLVGVGCLAALVSLLWRLQAP